MADAKLWLANIDKVRFNPSAIQRLALSNLEEASAGLIDVVDPTNPFVFLMEASAMNAAAGMVQTEALTRKLYPSMALTEDELYLHMSDIDYRNRFASPARTFFRILLGKEELYQRVVSTGVGSIKKLTIPRHTEVTIAGVQFSMQYPIDIRAMAHGGLQIVYDVEKLSPLETLQTNIVDWSVVNIEGVEYIRVDVPMSQFKISSSVVQLTLASNFSRQFTYTDQFYYARAFYALADGTWKEMLTTHTDQVFDPTKPTAVLKVNSGKLTVSLPQIYLTTQLVSTELRIDIYTTKGPLDMILDNYQINNFVVRWLDLEGDDNGLYVAPLTNFATMAVYSDQVVSGGTNGVTFEALRERVMTNALGSPNLPITNVQITTRLEDMGYDMVVDVDNVTNRQFKATRTLPRPIDQSVVAGAGCSIQTLNASMTELVTYPSVRDNGNRITLLPETLYQNVNGVVEIVPTVILDALQALPLDVRARRINEARYIYSPFHYVLDMNDNRFEHRAYFLDAPAIESKSFVEENDTTGLAVGTGNYRIDRVTDGYTLTITTRSSAAWKALSDSAALCQLSYRPTNERDRAYQNGTLVGTNSDGERIYTFDLGTDYDIDKDDHIVLNTFQMYDDPERKHPTPLLTDFDIMYIATGLTIEGLETSNIDLDMGVVLLPVDAVGVARERLSIRMGAALDNLWTASRSVVSSLDYQRYTADVPAIWENTVFLRNSTTGALELTVDGLGNLQYTVLHAQGDPVLDENDNPVYRFRVGDVVLDPDGLPVILSTRNMVRQIDLLFIDGVYWFASESAALTYKRSLPVTITGWVTEDISKVTRFLLEQTNLYFYPKATLGQVATIVMEDQPASLTAEQSFSVTFYLSGVAYRDVALRASLSKMAVETINEVLQNSTVTMSEIISRMTAKAGSDSIAVQVSGLGGSQELTAVTLEDDSARLSIKKIAVALADGTIGVEDDVSISFLQHLSN